MIYIIIYFNIDEQLKKLLESKYYSIKELLKS